MLTLADPHVFIWGLYMAAPRQNNLRDPFPTLLTSVICLSSTTTSYCWKATSTPKDELLQDLTLVPNHPVLFLSNKFHQTVPHQQVYLPLSSKHYMPGRQMCASAHEIQLTASPSTG